MPETHAEYWPYRHYLAGLKREKARDIEESYREKRDKLREQMEAQMRGQEWGGIQPQPRYKPAFYEMWGALPGTQRYQDYFEGMFPSLIRQFESILPTYKGFKTAEFAAEEAEKIEEKWSEWLKKRRPELKEQWWSLAPSERGERPWAFAPRIATRSF